MKEKISFKFCSLTEWRRSVPVRLQAVISFHREQHSLNTMVSDSKYTSNI